MRNILFVVLLVGCSAPSAAPVGKSDKTTCHEFLVKFQNEPQVMVEKFISKQAAVSLTGRVAAINQAEKWVIFQDQGESLSLKCWLITDDVSALKIGDLIRVTGTCGPWDGQKTELFAKIHKAD